jgi:DNA polymerase-3 subunit delta
VTVVDAPVYLLRGEDASVLREAVRDLVHRLAGDGDASLLVEEIAPAPTRTGGDDGEVDVAALVAAAQTPPFLTDRRIVVARQLEGLTKGDALDALLGYLGDPLPTTRLVLEWTSGRLPKALLEAVARAGGEVVDTSPGRKRDAWVNDQLRAAGLHVDGQGQARVVAWLGEDAGRLGPLVEVLQRAFGEGARLGVDDIEPYLGEEGGVPPWELTDAIDSGQIDVALHKLERMLVGGGRHPLALLATLHGHYARMLRLDGTQAAGEKEAAEVLGLRGSTFPARKALQQQRRLGHDRLVRAIALLAEADLDIKGTKDWPGDLVMEVLVARLAQLSKR